MSADIPRQALPFELDGARSKMSGYTEKIGELASELGRAMRTTSETWHDNVQADAVVADSSVVASSAEFTADRLAGSIEASDSLDGVVGVGSI
ncbi:hypothetical protein FWG95_01865, partial [Candidatus Saccharibacteria bacterium]|nr:hypothetical protein [Candidatus Saccharibacteria bacterium]